MTIISLNTIPLQNHFKKTIAFPMVTVNLGDSYQQQNRRGKVEIKWEVSTSILNDAQHVSLIQSLEYFEDDVQYQILPFPAGASILCYIVSWEDRFISHRSWMVDMTFEQV